MTARAGGAKFREIFRFELAYQARRFTTWFFVVALFAFGFLIMRSFSPDDEGYVNSPQLVAMFTMFGGLIWALLAGSIAGEAAARDIETGMHPLTYTAPVSKTEYLGGRFLAAATLNAAMMLGLVTGIVLSLVLPRTDAEFIGPHQPVAYLAAYFLIALPGSFVATVFQFSASLLQRRAMTSYLATILLGFVSLLASTSIGNWFGNWDVASLFDAAGFVGLMRHVEALTPLEFKTRIIALEPAFLANRLAWIGVAMATLALTLRRFRFSHPVARRRWNPFGRHVYAPALTGQRESRRSPILPAQRRFTFATAVRQTATVAWTSFSTIARSRIGLTLVAVLALGSAFFSTEWFRFLEEIPLLATTAEVLTFYTPPLGSFQTIWIVIPLLIVFYAGELIWKERDAGVNEIVDASPLPEGVLFFGKFLGLALVIVVWLAFFMAAGMLIQVYLGHPEFDIALYLKALFGFQLANYLLFALLALALQAVVDQKYLGAAAALAAYGLILFPSTVGLQHKLLIYGADPGWSYSPMRGFDPTVEPWVWFKLYWAAWAVLLAVAGTLLLARGREAGVGVRLRMARLRFKRTTAAVAATAGALVLAAGGFIFYNTNVLNAYRTAADVVERRAEYERRYGQYQDVAQPQLADMNLRVEIYPARREAEIRGSYRLVNSGAAAIDVIHVATTSAVETDLSGVDRPARPVIADPDFGHHAYKLETPLAPGETLRLDFMVRARPRGFHHTGIDPSVAAKATFFTNEWLPAIGYQADRELTEAHERRLHGLPPRERIPSLYDRAAHRDGPLGPPIDVDTVVGTEEGQTAIAPGTLRRTWSEGGRRYFHYATDVRIGNQFRIYSANYAVREAQWKPSGDGGATIQIFHHPSHTLNIERVLQSAHAALTRYTQWYGPYPYRHVRIVEHPGPGRGAHADANMIDHPEGFSLLNPLASRDVDLPYHIIAHEIAHQWWGSQLSPAYVEGAGVLSETLATYSAMQVLNETLGAEHLQRYLRFVRLEYQNPRSPAMPPLLQAIDGFNNYRKGPLALYALGEYIGQERVRGALRNLLEKHSLTALGLDRPFASSSQPSLERKPLPTTLDLYRELKAATPESSQWLLHDLFEKNTFWALEAREASAAPTASGEWQLTMTVRARKSVMDTQGVETEVAMDDWIEIGVYAAEEAVDTHLPPLVQKHRIRSGEQTIRMTVPKQPLRAGIDPRYLMMDWNMADNVKEVRSGR